MKKTPEDIIISHMCTINDTHMMYDSWDMECDGQKFLSFWTIFCTFTLLKTWKIKILKKWKKLLAILSFTHVYHKWQSDDVWFLRYQAQQTKFFVILDHFLLFTLRTTQKIKVLKKWKKKEKKSLEILSFYMCVS